MHEVIYTDNKKNKIESLGWTNKIKSMGWTNKIKSIIALPKAINNLKWIKKL